MVRIKQKKYIILAIAIFIVGIGIIFMTVKGKSTQDLETIDLYRLEKLITNTSTEVRYIYIGRESCPDCTTVYPRLCAVSQKQNLSLLYYTTEADRESQPEKVHMILEKLGVESVPMVIKVRDGNVVDRYDGETFIKMYEEKGM